MPWAIILACEVAFGVLFLVTRMYLAVENSRRSNESKEDKYSDFYVEALDDEGVLVQKKVDKVRCFFF